MRSIDLKIKRFKTRIQVETTHMFIPFQLVYIDLRFILSFFF